MNSDPIAHFQRLFDLTSEVQVTNRQGAAVSIANGVTSAVEMVLTAGRKIIVIGNGGSAAIASHLQNDLCHSVGVQALVFHDTPMLTAIANDKGYESVFQKPIDLWAKSGDLLIAISSSGQSENILRGVQAAHGCGCDVMTFSGFRGDNPLRQLGHLNFYISSSKYGEVEVSHMSLTHYVTDCALAIRAKAGAQL